MSPRFRSGCHACWGSDAISRQGIRPLWEPRRGVDCAARGRVACPPPCPPSGCDDELRYERDCRLAGRRRALGVAAAGRAGGVVRPPRRMRHPAVAGRCLRAHAASRRDRPPVPVAARHRRRGRRAGLRASHDLGVCRESRDHRVRHRRPSAASRRRRPRGRRLRSAAHAARGRRDRLSRVADAVHRRIDARRDVGDAPSGRIQRRAYRGPRSRGGAARPRRRDPGAAAHGEEPARHVRRRTRRRAHPRRKNSAR